jgi:hypothetical protein
VFAREPYSPLVLGNILVRTDGAYRWHEARTVRTLAPLGAGGMGKVYRARDQPGLSLD